MKTLNVVLSFVLFFSFSSLNAVKAQDEKPTVKSMLDGKNFVFVATSVSPSGGATRQLTSEYNVKVVGDSVVSYLPYFGKATSAPIGGQTAGIDFTSTKFDYGVKSRKKGGWQLEISPKDAQDVRKLNFTIFDNGNASLQVTSNNRETISYHGLVGAVK